MEKRAMEQLWKIHTDQEFLHHDVEATLETMTDDAFVLNVPTGMGGRGKNEVRFLPRQLRAFPAERYSQSTHAPRTRRQRAGG
jgi:carboxymethylenebutenolidase